MALLAFWQPPRMPSTIVFLCAGVGGGRKIGVEIAFNSIYGSSINVSKQLCLLGTQCDPSCGVLPPPLGKCLQRRHFLRLVIADLLAHNHRSDRENPTLSPLRDTKLCFY